MHLKLAVLCLCAVGCLAADLPYLDGGKVVYPKGNKDDSVKALVLALDAAELRAAVAEERLASIPAKQASDNTMERFRLSCKHAGIAQDSCLPDLTTGQVREKPKPSESKPKDTQEH